MYYLFFSDKHLYEAFRPGSPSGLGILQAEIEQLSLAASFSERASCYATVLVVQRSDAQILPMRIAEKDWERMEKDSMISNALRCQHLKAYA